ncbi:hypothetical protein ABZ946_32785 [Streptomyces sp. NPDC046324]|uniref:hypothetical protein n=1 Tax=Streptomyces sp. NPDC046324 TaxID=3154915 RepID=UPI0033EDFA0D
MSPAGRKITERLSDDALTAATGKGWAAWFAQLDSWGAERQGHTAIARHLVEAHGVNGWHAQSISVGYEQEVHLTPVRDAKTRIGLGHTKLPDADAVAAYKEFRRERFAELKTLLESEA